MSWQFKLLILFGLKYHNMKAAVVPCLHSTHGFRIAVDHSPTIMPHIKCGVLLLANVLLFWVLSKWWFLPSKPSAVITPPFATSSSSHPSICPCSKTWESMTITDLSLCSAERHCHRHVTASFHGPLALMRAHRRAGGWIYIRPVKHSVDEIIRALWGIYRHHKHCTRLCSRAIKVDVFLMRPLVHRRTASFQRKLFELAEATR